MCQFFFGFFCKTFQGYIENNACLKHSKHLKYEKRKNEIHSYILLLETISFLREWHLVKFCLNKNLP